jgi:hypothetical protein
VGLRNGKFTKEESETIKKAVEEYCSLKGINIQRLCSECDHKAELKGAWTEIAQCLPHRSVQAVYRHGLRQLHPYKRGAWTDDECEQLLNMVTLHGKKWASIGTKINRSADACRDKYREMSEYFVRGRWKTTEVQQLKKLIHEHLQVDKDLDWRELGKYAEANGLKVAWSIISKKMGNRSRLSCFKKWQKMTGLLSPSDGGSEQQYKEEDTQALPPSHSTAKVNAKMDTHEQVDMHVAPTAGTTAAMAVGTGNSMGASAEADLDVILLSDLVSCNVSRASDVDWDELRVENAQERWYELMEEFQNAATDDAVLAMGISEIAQLMLDQKTSALRAAETVEAVDLPSLQACDM